MIWCVEDDASILDIEVYTLQSTGFQAQGFADGGAFWSALESARELPELVVLDVMLPGVDGVELLRRMRPPLPPVPSPWSWPPPKARNMTRSRPWTRARTTIGPSPSGSWSWCPA